MRRPTPLAAGVLVAVGAVALLALLVPLFAGPAAALAPRELPIVLAGPPAATKPVATALASRHPGAFDVTVVADAAAADATIKDRAAYGAIVLGPGGPALHVASAAGPAVATLLTQATAGLGGAQPVPVVDVVPTDPDDPHGAAFAAAFLPLALTAMLTGVLTFLLVRRRAVRVVTLAAFAVLAGLAGAAVQHYWLGVLPGNYLADAGVIALVALAVAGTVAGLGALLGRAGLALGVVLVFLVGNALSGVSSAPELLPRPWGALGQALPIGAGATMLRSVAYFHGNSSGAAATVLGAYALAGLILVAAGRRGVGARPAQGAQAAGQVRDRVLAG